MDFYGVIKTAIPYIKYFNDLNLKHLYPKIEEYYNQKTLRGKGSLTDVFNAIIQFLHEICRTIYKILAFHYHCHPKVLKEWSL